MLILIGFLTFSVAPSALAPQGVLTQEKGEVNKTIIHDWSPAELPEMAISADVIAHVVIVDEKARVTSNQSSIETVYQGQVLSTLKSNHSNVSDGRTITFRKDGGMIVVDGRAVAARDADFPPLAVGNEYVLFLWQDPKTALLHVHYGGQGAFLIANGYVEQLSRRIGIWNKKRGRVLLGEFLTEIKIAASAKQP